AFLTAISGLFILSMFQNCAQHDGEDGVLGLSSANCSPYLKAAFNSDVYPYAITNCATCHVPNGPGKGKFADTDRENAWAEFSVISNVTTKFYNNSISTSHAPGVSGPQLESAVTTVRQALETAEAECLQSVGGGVPGVAVVTNATEIGLDVGDQRKTISWVLNSEVSPTVNSSGAIFFIDIQATSANYYVISRPRIRTLGDDIHVKGINILINGSLYELATLYHGIDVVVPAGTGEETAVGLLSEQAVIVSAEVLTTNKLEIGFDALGIGAPEETQGE
ncbi:MAG: hypothetical protein KDD40_09005, partial [Bdellovibrionales bacterium]|nr:hypothetical protein [Bdellovibrionales bacterium]